MTNELETGGPAFPCDAQVAMAWAAFEASVKPMSDATYIALLDSLKAGMSLRQYAAIKLRVPRSGIDWLDDMIREARRDDDARAAMQGFAVDPNVCSSADLVAEAAYEWADAMQKARDE